MFRPGYHSIFESENYVTIDFETTNKSHGHAKDGLNDLLLTVVRGPRIGTQIFWANEFNLFKLLSPIINSCDYLVAHNAKFEFQWLARSGFKLEELPPVWCTQIAEYVESGNVKVRYSLEESCKRKGLPLKGALVGKLMKGGVCPSEMPKPILEKYCITDVKITERLMLKQREILKDKGLMKVAATAFAFTPVAAELECTGMHLDKSRVDAELLSAETEIAELDSELNKITGGINVGSAAQMAHFLYEDLKFKELRDRRGNIVRNKPSKQFPEGQPKTDAETIINLKATNKKQRRFVELKLKQSVLRKQLTTYLGLYDDVCTNNGGLLRGNLNLTITGTHRLSSSKPNMQNQPRKFKRLFNSRHEGWLMGEADYAQLEFRSAIWYGDDTQGREDIANGVDVHAMTSEIIGIERTPAKRHTFKPLYGGSSGSPKEQEYYKAFKKKFKGVTEWQERNKETVLRTGELVMPTGFVFRWPDTRMTSSGYVTNSTMICNYPNQYLATAEMVKIGVIYLWRRMKELGMEAFLANTIHDSVVIELPQKEETLFQSILEKCMVECVIYYMREHYGIDFDVPLEVDFKTKDHWG